jgi:hypothetical protein
VYVGHDAVSKISVIQTGSDPDPDLDGVSSGADYCPNTLLGSFVDVHGCATDQVDPDADGVCSPGLLNTSPYACTGVDNCPTAANPDQTNTDAALSAAGAAFRGVPLRTDKFGDACDDDDDNDRFTDDVELAIGTNPLDNCPFGPGTNGDAWPLDNVVNGLANVTDILSYKGKLSNHVDATHPKRLDVDNSNTLNVIDILPFRGSTAATCN